MEKAVYQATGRRKSSVARVRLVPGTGKFEVNGRNFVEYIPSAAVRLDVLQPITITGVGTQYDVIVNVCGGGISGQAGAIRLGLSRALMLINPDFRGPLITTSQVIYRQRREEWPAAAPDSQIDGDDWEQV